MNHESIHFIACDTFSKLLQRPIGRWVGSDIKMEESSRADFDDEENIESAARRKWANADGLNFRTLRGLQNE